MYGFRDKRLVTNVIVAAHLIALLFGLAVALLYVSHLVALKPETAVTIVLALVGWVIAVDFVFLQVRLSRKHQLESKAITDIDKAMREFSQTAAVTVTFNNDFVVKPMTIPRGFWFEEARKKYQNITEETLKIREGFGKIYFALEAHEIAIIHLEHYYRFITIKIDEFIKALDDANTEFLNKTGDYNLTEDVYKEAVKAFDGIQEKWADVAVYLMDFRKILQNELLGKVFKRELQPRQPKKGYGSSLDKIATPAKVKKMVKDRDNQLGI